MNIVYVINSLGFGGAETQLYNLAKLIAKKVDRVSLVLLHDCAQVHKDNFENIGIDVINLGMTRGVPNPFYIFKLRKIFDRINPDIIHTHIAQANIISRLANFSKYKMICTAHNIKEGGNFIDFLYKITDSLCQLTTNVSQEAVDRYNQEELVKKNKCICINNGVDTDLFDSSKVDVKNIATIKVFSNNEFPTLLAVGRLCAQKNYDLMLDVISRVDANLIIVGEGGDELKINEKITSMKLAGKVLMYGTSSDLRGIYKYSDALLMTSLWEGLPIVLLEAMAMNVPIISTDVAGASEILRKSDCGLLLGSFDAVNISVQLTQFLSENKLMEKGGVARDVALNEYSMASVAKKWLRIYMDTSACSS